ncbi:MAG: asparagine--tRNA ligase, partial [Methanobacteriota archaeon]
MVQITEILKGKLTGREVELRGWIYRTRTVGGKIFVVLRDSTGVLQVTITKGEVRTEQFAAAEKALLESAVKVFGTIVQ